MSKIGLLLSSLFLTVVIACAQSPSVTTLLKQEDFIEKIESDSTAQVLDVRTPEEYAQGHIEGALNINYMDHDFQEKLKQLDFNRPVFVYCAAGGRSGKSCKMMETLGFTIIYDLQGGYKQ